MKNFSFGRDCTFSPGCHFGAIAFSLALVFPAAVFGHGEDDDSSPDTNSHVVINKEGDKRIIEANGLPDHKPGQFPNRGNPNSISPQHYRFEMPLKPQVNDRPRPVERYIFGIAVNGVVFDPGTAEVWRPGDPVVSRPGPNTRRGPNDDPRQIWNYDAMGKMQFGIDDSHAHVQPTGAYHYHGLPTGLIAQLRTERGPAGKDMLLIGYAADGFPIYAEYGHTIADDASSPLKKLRPSYHLKKGSRPIGDDGPGGKYDGTFVQDYEVAKSSGDLDECNGRKGVTPEYPNGTYYYVATDAYPFIPRFYRGTPDASFEKKMGPPPGGPGRRGGRRPRPPLPEGATMPLPSELHIDRSSAGGSILKPAEAKTAFRSKEALGTALKRRWPISAIKKFCILERRHNPYYQLLVPDSDIVWRGTLHAGENTGFDKIEWYATTTENGRGEAYSILVERGEDVWELEFGGEQTLTKPPELTPDPTQPHFAGHRNALKDTPFKLDNSSPPSTMR